MSAITSALVIGGGIAGPTVALALHKAGIDATIHEAYDAGADDIGGAFNIATNGLDALAAVDALEITKGRGWPAPTIAMHNARGRLIGEVSTGIARPDGTNTTTLRRAELFRLLSDEARRRGIRSEYGKRLIRYTESADSVTAHFADGSRATADILIGADGIRSTVRNLIDPDAAAPRYTGLLSFGGFAPNPGLAPEPGIWRMTFGSKAFLGTFVPDADVICWFVNMPSDEPLTRKQILDEGIDVWAERLIDLFRDDDVAAETIVRAQGTDGFIALGAGYDLPKVRHWHRGRVVIVGDAAHAASTSSGQGASMTMESAVTLGRCLRDCATPGQAFTTYEQLRRKRVDRIIAYGARTASKKAAGPVAARMRDAFMGIGLKYFYKPGTSDAWLLGHHIDFDAPVGGLLAAA